MSRAFHHGKDRRIRVLGIRRPTDLRRRARVPIDLEARKPKPTPRPSTNEVPDRSRRRAGSLGSSGSGVVSPRLAARDDA